MTQSDWYRVRWSAALGRGSVGFILTLLWSCTAHGAGDEAFRQTLRTRKHFAEVERVSRDHDHGGYRGGELTLRPFIEVDDHNFLGLDEAGRLMQVLITPERTLGFLMSGDRRVVDLFYQPRRILLAIDEAGEILSFNRERWSADPVPANRRRTLQSLGLSMVGAGGLLGYLAVELNLSVDELIAPAAFLTTVLSLQHGLTYLMTMSEENDLTDGLVSTGRTLTGYVSAERVGGDAGFADDYLLHGDSTVLSLKELVAERATESSPIFDQSCEKDLAQGYPSAPFDDRPSDSPPPPPSRLLGRRE